MHFLLILFVHSWPTFCIKCIMRDPILCLLRPDGAKRGDAWILLPFTNIYLQKTKTIVYAIPPHSPYNQYWSYLFGNIMYHLTASHMVGDCANYEVEYLEFGLFWRRVLWQTHALGWWTSHVDMDGFSHTWSWPIEITVPYTVMCAHYVCVSGILLEA